MHGYAYCTVVPSCGKSRVAIRLAWFFPDGKRSDLFCFAQLGSWKVGKAEALSLTVAVQDVSPNRKIGGLLGSDFLSRYHTRRLIREDNSSHSHRADCDRVALTLDSQGGSVTDSAILAYNFVQIEQNCGSNLAFAGQLGLYAAGNTKVLPI